jgi:hypothetical protein
MRAEEIKAAVPMSALLHRLGVKYDEAKPKAQILCPVHDEKNPSATYYQDKQTWRCHKCGIGGSIIDLVMQTQNVNFKDALEWLQSEFNLMDDVSEAKAKKFTKKDTFCYKDEHGKPLYYIDRLESPNGKKTFPQYHMKGGKKVDGVAGIRKVLLNLPAVLQSDEAFIFEGERKAKCLVKIDPSYPATCNAGGSSSWLASYAEFLRDKHVTICPDSDDDGQKWLKAVMESLEGVAASVRIARMPSGYNDFTDLVDALGPELAHERFLSILEASPIVPRGSDLPIYSADDLMVRYKEFVNRSEEYSLDLSLWLPSLRGKVRPCVPGDLITVLGDTGTGKTAILQNIAVSCKSLSTLFFELELSDTKMAERSIAINNNVDAWEVERMTKSGHTFTTDGWKHIYTCPLSKMDTTRMETLINKAELKIGQRPRVVLVDYIGLLRGGAGKRYERLSTIAEDLRILAKSTNTVMVIASQVARKEEDDNEIKLHDGKDSGSIESSSSLVLGAWKLDKTTMMVKVLKDNNRGSGLKIVCNHEGGTYRITERYTHNGVPDPQEST